MIVDNDALECATTSAVCLAAAVAATVFSAGPAGVDDALLQRLSSTKDAHASISRRKAALLREGLHWGPLHINRLKCVGVFRFQRTRESCNAATYLRFDFWGRRGVRLELTREGLDRAACRLAPSKAINGCIPEGSVEPRNESFTGRRLIRPIHHLDEGILQDVLSQLAVADATLEISKEGTVVLDQGVECRWRVLRNRVRRNHCGQYTGR